MDQKLPEGEPPEKGESPFPGHQWILKWPYHLWQLDALLIAFPDAVIVHLHRHPVEAIGSVCSLAALARSAFCEQIDDAGLGRFWLEYSEAGLQRGIAARGKAGTAKIIDIRYLDLMAEPEKAVERILKAADLDCESDWLNSAQTRSARQPVRKQMSHRYALSQFGVDPAEIRYRFSAYIEDFDLR